MGYGASAQGWVIAFTLVLALAAISASWVRAWRGLRQMRIVMHVAEPENGVPAGVILGLSPGLRERVREELRRQGRDAYRAEQETLDADIKSRMMTIQDSAASESYAALDAEMLAHMSRAVVPDTQNTITELFRGLSAAGTPEVRGLIAVLGSNLPAQRGWSIRVSPVVLGTGGTAKAGLTVELSPASGDADEGTTFWDSSEALRESASGSAKQAAAIREVLHGLLRPTARWIAIRLVARNLAQRQDGRNRLSKIFQRRSESQRQKLTGLQWLIAGQLSLYATRTLQMFTLGFVRQALEDLERAEELLPGYFRPPMTRGFVYEQKGWACRRAGDDPAARRAFAGAIRAYDHAEELLRAYEDPEVNAHRRDAEIKAIAVRRAKCRLLSGEYHHAHRAHSELTGVLPLLDTDVLGLYNAACAFAEAMRSGHLSGAQRASCEQQAWHHLGRALLASGQDDRAWSRVMVDEELAGMQERQRADFCAEIQKRHDGTRPLTDEAAGRLVEEAMVAIGLTPAIGRDADEAVRRGPVRLQGR